VLERHAPQERHLVLIIAERSRILGESIGLSHQTVFYAGIKPKVTTFTCIGAHGKHGYQQGVESFSYSFTIGAHHIIAGRHGRRKVSKSDHYRGPILS
jgi:hypothetical protein